MAEVTEKVNVVTGVSTVFAETTNKMHAALHWARLGFPVFPLEPNGKKPLPGSRGLDDATTDPDQIREMWTDPLNGAVRDYNIGARPVGGKHLVIDLDVKGGRDGIAAYEALGGEIAGLVTETPSGGRHIYLSGPDTRNTAGLLAPGIDSRGSRGYVVAPGSTINGKAYRVLEDGPMQQVPAAILDRLPRPDDRPSRIVFQSVESDQPQNIARAVKVAQAAESAATGTWHAIGYRLGCEMARIGLSPEKAVEVLATHWVPRGSGFKSEAQFERDVLGGYESAARAGEHGLAALPPVEDVFGEVIAPPAALAEATAPPPQGLMIPASAELVLLQTSASERHELLGRLAVTSRNEALPTLANMILIVKADPLLKGLVGLDAFAGRMMIARPPPQLDRITPPAAGPYSREFRDDDHTRILAWTQQTWCPAFRGGDLSAALDAEARDNAFHPVCDFLGALTWDGVPRIERWLCDAFNCAETPLHSAIGWKWLVAAVRRVRQPGCKFDYLPVLQGDQGIGKSRALAVLFGQDFFTDQLPDNISSTEAPLSMAGKWCVELGEITQLVKNETETVKAFLSRSTDRYRVPYARRPIDVPRQCVLIGTTNPGQYLRDPTGNRRFWPVECGAGPANVKWLAENRLQIWAEAAWMEAQGASIWLDDDGVRGAAEAAQAGAMEEDPWTDRILRHVAGRKVARIPDVLTAALSVPAAQQDKRLQNRVASVLRIAGWVRKSAWDSVSGKSFWQWHAPAGWVAEPQDANPFLTTSSPPIP